METEIKDKIKNTKRQSRDRKDQSSEQAQHKRPGNTHKEYRKKDDKSQCLEMPTG